MSIWRIGYAPHRSPKNRKAKKLMQRQSSCAPLLARLATKRHSSLTHSRNRNIGIGLPTTHSKCLPLTPRHTSTITDYLTVDPFTTVDDFGISS